MTEFELEKPGLNLGSYIYLLGDLEKDDFKMEKKAGWSWCHGKCGLERRDLAEKSEGQ